MAKKTAFLLGLFFVLAPFLGRAQTSPYLVGATLTTSVDYWGEFWVNGHEIWDMLSITKRSKGPSVNRADRKASLCYFGRENVLAISLADSKRPEDLVDPDFIGIAYVLELDFSDGTKTYLSSDEASEHTAYYAPNGRPSWMYNWPSLRFPASGWLRAIAGPASLPNLADVTHPGTGRKVRFMTASGSTLVREQGEEHLFRRRFYLNLSPRPDCQAPATATPTRSVPLQPEGPRHEPDPIAPAATSTDTQRPTRTDTPTRTFTPLPSMPAKYLPSPQPEEPAETPTPRPLPPTVTPLPLVIKTPVREPGTRTKAPTATFTPEVEQAPALPEPTATPVPQQVDVSFEAGAANILVTFNDGPGVYHAQVEDLQGRLLKVILDRKVVATGEDWLEWDGTDEQGREMAPGIYKVVYSKDGKVLKTLKVRK